MTKPPRSTATSDFSQLGKLITGLINQEKLASASYVIGILQTDLAERGHEPTRQKWPVPGEAAPVGWDVYEAVLHWCTNEEHWNEQLPGSSS